jgi:hypothetical protein
VTSPTPARRRNPALVALDVIAGILILGFGILVTIAVLGAAIDFGGLHTGCGPGPYDGITCSAAALGAISNGLIIVCILALFLGFGMFVVSLIRKRVAFYWPLIGIVVTIAAFYLAAWIASLTLPGAS